MIATSDKVQSEPHSHTEYVKFEPSQHTTIVEPRRFSYRQSQSTNSLGSELCELFLTRFCSSIK
jgi:hypothetical protein